MEFYMHRPRRTGLFLASLLQAAVTIANDETLAILSLKENDYADRMAKALKEIHGIEVTIERTTRKEPMDNRKPIFDSQGEMIGIDILPQTDKFTGWILKKKI